MRIHLANYEERIGGGWTFLSNFKKGFESDVEVSISDYDSADVYFIASASIVQREAVMQAKQDGKRIILRVDNALRPSRNRGTGMTRLKDFADLADLIVYQSEWARALLKPFLGHDGAVILNGVDTSVYNPTGRVDNNDYLYVRSSRDEGKQWIMAWYYMIENQKQDNLLNIVGRFSSENIEWNFDFYNDQRYRFWGEQRSVLDMYRANKYFLYTYLNDACSNTLLEALACGCEIIDVYGMLQTGGAPEIMNSDISLDRMIKEYKEVL